MNPVQDTTTLYHKIMPDNIKYPRNYLDEFLSVVSEKIRLQKKIEKSRINTSISTDTFDKFQKFVKKRHHGVIKGPYSYELERAMLFYLHFYDV